MEEVEEEFDTLKIDVRHHGAINLRSDTSRRHAHLSSFKGCTYLSKDCCR